MSGIPPYVPYEGDLGLGTVIQPADWNGMFDTIGTYLNSVLAASINALNASAVGAVNQGRLYLTSGNPFADNASSSNIYFGPLPNLGNKIAIENPSSGSLVVQTFSECSLSLSGLTALLPYDVYVSIFTATTLQISLAPWTNSTTPPTRSTDIAGRLCANGNTGALWVGAFVAATATTTQDWAGARYLQNQFNSAPAPLRAQVNTSSTIGTAGQPINNNVTNGQGRVSALAINTNSIIDISSLYYLFSPSTTMNGFGGIGLNSASVYSAEAECELISGSVNQSSVNARLTTALPVGVNFVSEVLNCSTGTLTASDSASGNGLMGMYQH